EIPRGREHPVSDLALDCQLNVKNDQGAVILELVKWGRQFRCQISLNSGKASLSISGQPDFAPQADTGIQGPGAYDVSFSNVDEQLLLWVNGKLIEFNVPTTYEHVPPSGSNDLSPAGIGVEGGAAVEVSHLKLWRDIYYSVDADDGRLREFVKA